MDDALPELTVNGLLPSGRHLTSIESVVAQFGGTSHRGRLAEALLKLHQRALAAGAHSLLIGGSFVSSKPRIFDLDVIVFGGPACNWPSIPEQIRSPGGPVDIWRALDITSLRRALQLFGVNRAGLSAGLAEIPLLGAPLSSPSILNLDGDIDADMVRVDIRRLERLLESIDASGRSIIEEELDRRKTQLDRISSEHFYLQCLNEEPSRPAATGIGDVQVNSLVGMFAERSTPFTLVDLGCGTGRLLAELATLDDTTTGAMTYVGLDYDVSKIRGFVDEQMLAERFDRIVLANVDQWAEWRGQANYAVSLNVLHEVPLLSLPDYFSRLVELLEPGGVAVLHDMASLRQGEQSFVPWSGKEASTVLEAMGYSSRVREHSSRSGVPLFTLYATADENRIPGRDLLEVCEYILTTKEQGLIEERREVLEAGLDSRRFAYLSVVIANIRDQLLATRAYR